MLGRKKFTCFLLFVDILLIFHCVLFNRWYLFAYVSWFYFIFLLKTKLSNLDILVFDMKQSNSSF